MIYHQKGVIRRVRCNEATIRCDIGGVIEQRCDMRGKLIPAGLDGLAAMDRRHQHHQYIGSEFVLLLPGSGPSGLLGNAT